MKVKTYHIANENYMYVETIYLYLDLFYKKRTFIHLILKTLQT